MHPQQRLLQREQALVETNIEKRRNHLAIESTWTQECRSLSRARTKCRNNTAGKIAQHEPVQAMAQALTPSKMSMNRIMEKDRPQKSTKMRAVSVPQQKVAPTQAISPKIVRRQPTAMESDSLLKQLRAELKAQEQRCSISALDLEAGIRASGVSDPLKGVSPSRVEDDLDSRKAGKVVRGRSMGTPN